MRALGKIYWLRAIAGVIAGILSAFVSLASGNVTSQNSFGGINTFFNGVTIFLAIFLFSYYVFKFVFGKQVEKQSKLFTTGIGIYILAWVTMWVLLFTLVDSGVI